MRIVIENPTNWTQPQVVLVPETEQEVEQLELLRSEALEQEVLLPTWVTQVVPAGPQSCVALRLLKKS